MLMMWPTKLLPFLITVLLFLKILTGFHFCNEKLEHVPQPQGCLKFPGSTIK